MFIRAKALCTHRADSYWTWFLWLLAPLLVLEHPVGWVQAGQTTLAEVRTLYPNEWGVPYPVGLSYASHHEHLALLAKRDAAPSTDQATADGSTIVVITPYEDLVGTATLAFVADNAINIAYDDANDHLLLLNNEQAELARVVVGEDRVPDPAALARFDIAHLGLEYADGMDVVHEVGAERHLAGKRLFILDSGTAEVVAVNLDDKFGLISKIDLSHLDATDPEVGAKRYLRGIAVHPATYNLFVMSPPKELLYELTQSGQLVNTYDLAGLDLVDPGGMAFGPSADLTDAPETMHLFMADSNRPDAGLANSGQQPGINRVDLSLLVQLISDILLGSRMRPAPAETAPVFGRILEVALAPAPAHARSVGD